jgi:hypothetical protein
MLTPRHRALFEASLSALLLPSGAAEPGRPPASPAPSSEAKKSTDNSLPIGLEGSDAVARADAVEGGL